MDFFHIAKIPLDDLNILEPEFISGNFLLTPTLGRKKGTLSIIFFFLILFLYLYICYNFFYLSKNILLFF